MFPFWNDLTQKQQAQIEVDSYTEKFAKNELVKHAEDSCKGLISVVTGAIRAYIVSEEGREITLFRVYAGNVCVLSASCLMDSIEFDVCVEAVEDTEVMILPLFSLNSIMHENSKVELYMYKTAAEKFSEVMWTMQQILFKKIDQRVAAFLWDEYVRANDMMLTLTHDEIARYIGSAREVVTKVLKYMENQGVIELQRGKISIIDKEKLKNYI